MAVPATQPLSESPGARTEALNDTVVESAPITSSDKTRQLDPSRRNKKRADKNRTKVDDRSENEDGHIRADAAVASDASAGNVLQRGDKLRKVSIVLDEAAYDPSLRFVLVAAALFILFIVIVILNKIVG